MGRLSLSTLSHKPVLAPASPQLTTQLTKTSDLAALLRRDETITQLHISNDDITNLSIVALSLQEVRLTKIIAASAQLERTSWSDCVIDHCELTATHCSEASWRRIELRKCRASGLQLQHALLEDILFEDCKLNLANFRLGSLKRVIFRNCDLTEADFYSAVLQNVSFENCQLDTTEFSAAQLRQVDLRSSNITTVRGLASLSGAIIDDTQLIMLAPALAAHLHIHVEPH
jgi:uncharacterized protein YjbI with pentapeptide repeats